MSRYLLDRDPRREQARQSRLLDRMERRYRKAFAKEVARASRQMVEVYELTGEVPPPRDHMDAVQGQFERLAVDSFKTFGGRVVDQGKAAGFILERKEDFAQRMLRAALLYVQGEAVRRHITQIAETTRAQIVAQVDRGYRDGLGVSEIARSIRNSIPSLSQMRGALIARTETHGAANAGADEGARSTGLQLRKEWVAAGDERTRQDHAEADGQIVGMDDAFEVGSDNLMYPGDPSGSAGQIINCRCAVAHIVID